MVLGGWEEIYFHVAKIFKGFYRQVWSITTFKCIKNVCSMWSRVASRQNGRLSNRKWETAIWFILGGTETVPSVPRIFSGGRKLCSKSNIYPVSLRIGNQTVSASSGIKTLSQTLTTVSSRPFRSSLACSLCSFSSLDRKQRFDTNTHRIISDMNQ